jgi:hypothetical protein
MINNTSHTNNELLSIIVPAFNMNGQDDVMVDSPSFCNKTLVEFSKNDPFDLEDCIDYDGVVTIQFTQSLTECGPDCCGDTKYDYTILIRTKTLAILVDNTKTD